MKRIVALLALFLVVAGAALAQEGPLLREYGSLQSGDRRSRDGVYEDRFSLVVPSEGTVVVTVVSPDFEPTVVLDAPGQDIRDAGGSGNAARTTARVEARDEIEIRVSALEQVPEDFAEYLLVVSYGVSNDLLVLGSSVIGELRRDDEQDGDGSYIDYYDLDLPPDVRVRVDMSSFEFDTYLQIDLPDGDYITNDDFNGTDSSISFSSGQGGTARVGATSFGYQSTGEYTLTISDVASQTISVGDFVPGQLEGGQAIYTLTGSPGELVAVELRSDSFDTYLELTDASGTYLYNDDAEGFDVSRIVYEISGFGEAEIIVSSFGEAFGDFTLEVYPYQYDGPEIVDGYLLSDGEEIAGFLGPHLPTRNGNHEQRFTFDATRGERVEVVLRSDDFDSYLTIIGPDGSQFTDDDGAGNLNSRLTLNISQPGVYDVYARDLGGGSIGNYVLSFSRLPPAQMILTTEGELTQRSPQDITGKYYATYDFRVRAGANITINVRSDDYDGYAIVRSSDGTVLYRDDDSGGSGDPKIEFIADRSETLELVVTTFSAGATGRYTVEVFE